jgi:nucleoside-diphosphate-sugar epimerase
MKLWVTGASGFVGRQVCEKAMRAGHEVLAIARPGSSASKTPGQERRVLDLRDEREITSLMKKTLPDAIIHLAWYAHPQDYLVSVENVRALETTLAFARAVLAGGCRKMVGVGTCLEYADLPRPRSEQDPIDPRSLYARCKHAAHLVLTELFAREGATLSWARLFHMHGPGEHPARLVPSVAAALRAGKAFGLSPGEQVRDHMDVRDVAAALVHLAERDVQGPVNVCSGKPVTLRAVLEVIGRELGREELLEFGRRPYMPTEVMNLSGTATLLMDSGFRPRHADLAMSLREFLHEQETQARR